MKPFRLRLITNLHCNNNCYFCYQKDKRKLILSVDNAKKIIDKLQLLQRCTIMGGESTLLNNLHEYIELAKRKCSIVCLVTNGRLLTYDSVKCYAQAGLDEIAISISSIENYEHLKEQIKIVHEILPNSRVNLPKSYETTGDKLYFLIDRILTDGFGVVVCEDLMGRYGTFDFEKNMGAVKVTEDYNFYTYKYKNYIFGLFAHWMGYNNTDVIVTPVGNFNNWDRYCEKIGNYDLC